MQTAEKEQAEYLEQQPLAQAFADFSTAAEGLERSYFGLRNEIFRLRQELEAERDLRRRQEALAEISALLAHEIRNPLGSMELFAEQLARSIVSEQEKGWLTQIQSGLRILAATVTNILEFHGPQPPAMTQVDLNEILKSVECLLKPVGEQAGVRWISQLSSDSLWIDADRNRLQQVFLNLGLNAIRFAAAGGVLKTGSASVSGRALVSVSDNGPGIEPKLLPKIFEAGARSRRGGAGLGLAVAKRIVEQHHGTIRVMSSSAEGACFQLSFRLANHSQAEQSGVKL